MTRSSMRSPWSSMGGLKDFMVLFPQYSSIKSPSRFMSMSIALGILPRRLHILHKVFNSWRRSQSVICFSTLLRKDFTLSIHSYLVCVRRSISEGFNSPDARWDLSEAIKKNTGSRKWTYCSFLGVSFSALTWLCRMWTTTLTRSSGVKNHASVGGSGKKNQKSIEVRMPVIVTNHSQVRSLWFGCECNRKG